MSNNNQNTENNVEVKQNNKVVEVKAKDVAKDKKKKDKAKKPNKMAKALKDTGNELIDSKFADGILYHYLFFSKVKHTSYYITREHLNLIIIVCNCIIIKLS